MGIAVIGVFLVVLVGAFVGWCAGWMAHGEQNRGWYAGVVRRLEAQLADAREELDAFRTERDWVSNSRWQPPATPAVVNVLVAPSPGCLAPAPVTGSEAPVLDPGVPPLGSPQGPGR